MVPLVPTTCAPIWCATSDLRLASGPMVKRCGACVTGESWVAQFRWFVLTWFYTIPLSICIYDTVVILYYVYVYHVLW